MESRDDLVDLLGGGFSTACCFSLLTCGIEGDAADALDGLFFKVGSDLAILDLAIYFFLKGCQWRVKDVFTFLR